MLLRYALLLVATTVLGFAQTPIAPTISGTLGDKIATVGDQVQFWIAPSGSQPFTYQWLKNGAPISNGGSILGATSEVLQISNIQRSDDAMYSLRVTNSAGTATSSAAHLTVRELRIVTQPANQSVTAGGTATFSVGVSATDPITYQWYKNNNLIAGATGSTLMVTNASATDVGTYYVSVHTVVNTISSASASLSVAAPPVISVQPSNTSALIGRFLSLVVGVTGQGPFTYQWYNNGTPISGATAGSFSKASAQLSDSGSYYVVVSNGSGSVTSNAAAVTVFGLTISGATQKVYDGTPLTVTATTEPAGLPVTISYAYRNTGTPLNGAPVAAGFYRAIATVNQPPYFAGTAVDITITAVAFTVTFGNLQQTYDGNPHPVTVTTTPAGVPLTLEYGGANRPAPIAAGTYEVIAYSNDYNYLPTSTAKATLVVAKAAQSITVGAPPATAQVGTPFALTATASSGLTPLTFSVVSGNATLSGSNLTVNDTNPATIRATQAGDANYNAATADFTFSLGKQSQAISFPALANRLTSAAPELITATASSGLPVTLSIVSGPATITGNTLTLTGTPGTVIVRAIQPGSSSYNAAPAVERTFTVTASSAPVITVQPTSQTVSVGGDATFSVSATGTGQLTYQWLKNGVALGNFSLTTITLRSLQISDSSTISVVVSNGDAFTTSAPATLSVVPVANPSAIPPVIGGQTASQSVTAGEPATVMVSAGGTSPLYYQWRKDGVPIAGATLSDLVILNFQASNAGNYSVVVQNSAGTITSPNTTLSLATPSDTGAPTITNQPTSQLVVTGFPIHLAVTAQGTAPLSYQWYKNGTAIAGATQAVLDFPLLAQLGDAGAYSVLVSNTAGSVTSVTATVSVVEPVTFTAQPVSQTAVEGATASFSVGVAGTPPFSYTWLKNGSPIPGAASATFTLSSVRLSDAGTYSVEVGNYGGSRYSAFVTLTVTPATSTLPPVTTPPVTSPPVTTPPVTTPPVTTPPVTTPPVVTPPVVTPPVVTMPPSISSQPVSQTVRLGSSATFAFAATGAQTYQWQKDGNNVAGATGPTLTVTNAKATDAGSYRVVVTNSAGSTTSAVAVLTVSSSSFVGTYFGTFAAGGSWALYVRPDLSAVFVGYVASTKSAIVQDLVVNPDGSFNVVTSAASAQRGVAPVSVTPRPTAAAAGTVLSGTINGGQVTGQIAALGVSFSGSADTATTATAKPGYYAAPTLGATTGGTYAVVGASGKAVVVTTSSSPTDAATGTVDGTGKLTTTTAAGTALSLQIDPQADSINGTVGTASFSGLADGVASTSRLMNLSVRSTAGSGDATLAVGFVTSGTGTKQVLLRGIGPTLAQFNVSGTLGRPELQLFDASGNVVERNNGWGGGAALIDAFNRVGAFALPSTSVDAALFVPLAIGQNTVQVAGPAGTRGVALIEAYDADGNSASARFINMSARTESGTGAEALTIGFVVAGNAPVTVLVRGIGPALTPFGVSGVLPDPELVVFEGNKPLATNNDWAGTDELTSAFTRVGAFSLSRTSKDASLLLVLKPGAYTARVTDVAGRTGVALIEVYEVR